MSPDLKVRPPRQGRTQEAWERILDAGLAILEEHGYPGFTIAAVCERAGVTPPTIYARVRTKEALYFAVFQHGFAPIRSEQMQALDVDRWAGDTPQAAVRAAVEAIARTSLRHESFLREIARRAEADPQIAKRTHEARAWTADLFRSVALRHPESLRTSDAEALDACFRVVFATLMARIAVPSALDIGAPRDDDALIADLQETAVRLLFPDEPV